MSLGFFSPTPLAKFSYSGAPGWALLCFAFFYWLRFTTFVSSSGFQLECIFVELDIIQGFHFGPRRELLEFAMQAVGRAVNGNQNRIFNYGTIRPDRFPSSSFADWLQWKIHYIAVAEANRWTDPEAIGALPVCLSGHALEEFQAAPR